ncbi:KxYKxGKxW signal peptide domain-containing protein [Leuconostoc citreum]
MPSKKYKLYKDGKSLVIGAIAVAGVMATTGITHVSADTVTPNATAKAVKTTDASQSDKQVSLQPAQSKDTAVKTETTPAVKSDVPTSVPTNVTQDEAKKTVDTAQDTVKGNVDTAQKAGVDVTKGGTQDVTINKDNASSKTNEILSDLNKQDQTVKEATAKQEANQKAYDTATKDHDDTVKQGQADLATAQANLDKAVADAKTSGIQVTTALSQLSPEYKALTGLTGQDLLDAMAYNKDLYQKSVAQGVATQAKDTKTLQALTAEYNQAVAQYQAEKAKVEKANADKKAAYDKALQDYLNATNHSTVMTAKTNTDMSSGQYKTFMTADVNQSTGEFSLKHDMNDGVSIIGRGELKGKVNYQVITNGDGTETIKVTGIDLYSYTYTNLNVNTAVNQNINFHVYDNNGNELYSRYHDGQTSFSDTINKSFGLNKSLVLTPGQQSDMFDFLRIDDNWIYNTHGKVFIAFQNTNKAPDLPSYDPQPTAPSVPSATVHQVKVAELPTPEAPAPQKVGVHYYNVTTTPDIPVPTAVPATPAPKVVQASILPHTGVNEKSDLSMLSALAGIASLVLLGAVSKKFKKHN